MENISLDQFQRFTPMPKNPRAITICNQKQLNINPKLLEELPMNFEIGVGSEGKLLCIREKAAGYKELKGGAIKAEPLIQCMLGQSVTLPARYAVTKQGDVWIAELKPQKAPILDMKKPPRKPKTTGLSGVMRELEDR